MATVKKCLISVFLLFAFVLSGCNYINPKYFKTGLPEKGVWYCEELKMEISFESRYAVDGYYVDNDGKQVLLSIDFDFGNKYLTLYHYYGRDDFFHGECDYWDEDKMLITEWLDEDGKEKGKSYLFIRQDED